MKLVPRISLLGWMTCTRDYEADGLCLSFEWLGFVVEIAFARIPRP